MKIDYSSHRFRFLLFLVTVIIQCNAQPKDIFLLAGQSNMVGHGGSLDSKTWWDGVVPSECKSNPSILRFAKNLTWEEAREPLHLGIDPHCNHTCGVGPGMSFANTLLKLQASGESIGLVPCAVSGSSLISWEKGTPYYNNLIDRARASTGGVGVLKALLWYQGESDTRYLEAAKSYGEKFEKFVNDLRTDLSLPTLPIIQVALASGFDYVKIVRAQQLGLHIQNLQCVDASDLQLEPDHLHLTTKSQVILGEKLAHTFVTM